MFKSMEVGREIHSSRGFTITEIMVTIAVAALLMGIAIPSFLAWLPTLRLSDAARQVATDLQLARTRAISTNTAVTVAFDTGSDTYTYGTSTVDVNDLYPGISIQAVTGGDPAFTARGTTNNGGTVTVTLTNGTANSQVEVTIVGRVRIL